MSSLDTLIFIDDPRVKKRRVFFYWAPNHVFYETVLDAFIGILPNWKLDTVLEYMKSSGDATEDFEFELSQIPNIPEILILKWVDANDAPWRVDSHIFF